MRGSSRPVLGRVCSWVLSFVLIAGPATQAVPAFASSEKTTRDKAVPSLISDDSWREPTKTTRTETTNAESAEQDTNDGESHAPTVVRELVDKRTETSTQYLLSDGTIRAEITQVPTRFQEDDGSWTNIDTSLVPADEFGAVETAATSVTATFDRQEPDEAPVTLSGDDFSVGLDMLDATENARLPYNDTMRYLNVAEDADLEYQATRTGFKETVIMRSADAPNIYRFKLTLNGLELKQDEHDRWGLYRSDSDERVYDLGALVVFDSSADAAGDPAYCGDATMSVEFTDDGNAVVSYEIPKEWLEDPARVYPVQVDPTLTGASATADAYISSKYPSTNYGGSSELRCGYYDSTTGHNRSLVRFLWDHTGSDAVIPDGAYVVSSQIKLYLFHQYYTSTATSVRFARIAEDWGAATWNDRPSAVYHGSESVSGRGVWVTHEIGNIAQLWVNDYTTNHGIQAYQLEDGSQNTTHWKKFYSSDYSDSTKLPKLVVTYSNPALSGASTVDKSVYRIGDTVTAKVRMSTGWPGDVNCLRIALKGLNANGERVSRGEMQWTETAPSSSWGNVTTNIPGAGGGYVSSRWLSGIQFLATQCIENVANENDGPDDFAEVTFKFKILDNYGDIQDNDFEVLMMMNPTNSNDLGNQWYSSIQNFNSSFSVAPKPLTGGFSISKTASRWFRESIEESTGVVLDTNDRADEGRGAFNLSWSPTTGATGYKILMSDGYTEREIGRTFGNSATTFTTQGLGIYPSDTTLNRVGAYSTARDPFGSEPLAASSLITAFNTSLAGAGLVVTDGTDLYVHKWAGNPGPSAWTRVHSGLSGETPGGFMNEVGASTDRNITSAVMIDGKIYEGASVTSRTIEGIWKDEPAGSTARTTLSFDRAFLNRYGLTEVTGAATIMIAADTEARKIYSVSNDRDASVPTFKIREYTINSNATGATYSSDHTVTFPGQAKFGDFDGLFVARGQLFLTEWVGQYRTFRIDTSTWAPNGMWKTEGAASYGILSACYDPSSGSVFAGRYNNSGIRRYAGPALDLRDNPKKLYAATSGTTNDAKTGYQLRVVPCNSADLDSTTINLSKSGWYSLDNRTVTVDQDPRHTTFDLGTIAGARANAALEGDSQSLSLDVTDLSIASYGPEASLSRVYDSEVTSDGYLTPGWRFGFEQRITPSDPDATCVTYIDDAGERHVFTYKNDQWFAANGFVGWIEHHDNLLPFIASDDTWTITLKDRSVLTFDTEGTLKSESDSNGNTVNYDIGDDRVTITAANENRIELDLEDGKATEARYITGTQQRTVAYDMSADVLDVTYYPDVPDESVHTQFSYNGGRIVQAKIVGETFSGVEAHWDMDYDVDGRLESVTNPALKAGGDRPVTSFTYGYDMTQDLDVATVTQPALIKGEPETVIQRFGSNPSGTMAFMSNERLANEEESFWRFEYSPANEVLLEESPTGARTEKVYDSNSNVLYAYDEMRHLDTYQYDERDCMTLHVDPRGTATYAEYDDENGNLLWIESDLATTAESTQTIKSRTEYEYDTRGLVTLSRTLLDGNRWLATKYSDFAVDGQPQRTEQVAQVKDGDSYTDDEVSLGGGQEVASVVTSSIIDSFGQMLEQTDAGGLVTMRDAVYTPAGKLTQSTDVDGVVTHYAYDALGNLTETSQTVEATSGPTFSEWHRYQVDAYGRTVRESDIGEGGVENTWTSHTFDAVGNEVATTDSIEGTTTVWYDARGKVTAQWIPGAGQPGEGNLQAASRWTFDADGVELTQVEAGKPDSDAITKEWRPDGLLLKVTDADGSWERYEYDDGGNQIAEISPADDGETDETLYDDEEVDVDDGEVAERTYYDLGGRVSAQKSSDGLTTHTSYDRAGRPVRVYTSKETETVDGEGNVTVSTTENTVSQMVYNELGWTLESGDADGVVTNSVYDVLGNSLEESVWAAGATSPKSTTSYVYDSKKRIIRQSVNESGKNNVIEFGYDAFGRKTSEVHAKNGVTSRDIATTYDEFGRETRIEDRQTGVVSRYSYAAGAKKRSTTNTSFGAVSATSTVDALGRDTTQTATIELDGRMVAVNRSVAWDTVKNLPTAATVQVGGVGTPMSATYDDTDKLTAVTGGLWGSGGLTMTYDRAADGGKGTGAKKTDSTSIPWGSGYATSNRAYTFTDSGRLASVTIDGSRAISYEWDSAGTGNLLSVTDGSTVTTFENENGHVKTATTGSSVTTYAYGDTGRRESETNGSTTTTYSWTGDDTLAAWDKKVSGVTQASAAYTYDGDGQRMSATVIAPSAWSPSSAVETTYTYGWDGLALRYYHATSEAASATIDYLHFGDDRPYVAGYTVNRSGETTSAIFQLMANDHGDVVALADESGEVFARYTYGPYGEAESVTTRATSLLSAALAQEIADANPIRYAGYDYDTWSGQYYLQARYYDPATKQFISKDPAEADGEESAYQYCSGDPIHQVDPTGLWGWGGLAKAVSSVRRSVTRTVRRAARVVRSVAKKVVRRAVTAVKHAKTRIVQKAAAVKRSVTRTVNRVKSRVKAIAAAAKQKARAVRAAIKRKAAKAAKKVKAAARKAKASAKKALSATASVSEKISEGLTSKQGLAAAQKILTWTAVGLSVGALVAAGTAAAPVVFALGVGAALMSSGVTEVRFQKGYINNTERVGTHTLNALGVVIGGTAVAASLRPAAEGAKGLAAISLVHDANSAAVSTAAELAKEASDPEY